MAADNLPGYGGYAHWDLIGFTNDLKVQLSGEMPILVTMKSIIGRVYKVNPASDDRGVQCSRRKDCLRGQRVDPAHSRDSVAHERSSDKRWQSGPLRSNLHRILERFLSPFLLTCKVRLCLRHLVLVRA